MADTTDRQAVGDALADLRRAAEAALAVVDGTPDAQVGLEYAVKVEAEARRVAMAAAELRDRKINEIWETEELSIAQLGKRIGVSKTRAFQILGRRSNSRRKP